MKPIRNRSDISRADVAWWMRQQFTDPDPSIEKELTVIAPVIGRDGWYRDRRKNVSWLEYQGQARMERSGNPMFAYRMRRLCSAWLTSKEVAAYRELLRLKPPRQIRKALSEILDLDQEKKELREVRRNSRLSMMRLRNKLKA